MAIVVHALGSGVWLTGVGGLLNGNECHYLAIEDHVYCLIMGGSFIRLNAIFIVFQKAD